MSQKTKIILANARLLSGNLGCVALSECAMLLVDTVMTELGCDYELFLSDSGYHDKREKVLEMAGRKIRYKVCTYPNEPGFARAIRVFARNLFMKWPNEFKSADIVLNAGQGDSFSDIYGLKRFKRTDLCDVFAARYGVPYVFLPQTLGPFNDPVVGEKAGRSLAGAEYVMCRDAYSKDFCREAAPDSPSGEFVDMAFMLPFSNHERRPGDGVHVGLNVSALLWNGGYGGNNRFGLVCDYPGIVRSIIEYFKSLDGVTVHLVPHVIAPGNEVEDDASVCTALVREYACSSVVSAPAFTTASQAKSYISSMDFFLGARMHSTIAAFSAAVPVVPMAYSRKFTGMFGRTLQYPYLVDMCEMDGKAAMDYVKACFADREKLRAMERERLSMIVDVRLEQAKETLKKIISSIR